MDANRVPISIHTHTAITSGYAPSKRFERVRMCGPYVRWVIGRAHQIGKLQEIARRRFDAPQSSEHSIPN